jgi:hypothetical protein
MSQEIILVTTYWLLVIVMLVGVVGALIPVVPGPSLIVVATIASGVIYGWDKVTWSIAVAIIVFLLCTVIDYLSGILGAQKAGASNWGQIGSMIGLGLGFFGLLPALPVGGPIVGIFFGPFIGAVIGEFLYLKELPLGGRSKQSIIAGVGIVVGSILGLIIQGLLSLGAMIFFLVTTFHLGILG